MCLKTAPHHMNFLCGAVQFSCNPQLSYKCDCPVLLNYEIIRLWDLVFWMLMEYYGWNNGLEQWIEFGGGCFVAHVQYWRSWIIWYYSYALTYTIVYIKTFICWPSQIIHQIRCLLAINIPLLCVCHYWFCLRSNKSIVAWLNLVPIFGSGVW